VEIAEKTEVNKSVAWEKGFGKPMKKYLERESWSQNRCFQGSDPTFLGVFSPGFPEIISHPF
jgi:hypothetical protein